MTLTTAKRQWGTRRRRYVVGYIASGNMLYHRDISQTASFPMTRREARTKLAEMPEAGCAIFELRPIEVNR